MIIKISSTTLAEMSQRPFSIKNFLSDPHWCLANMKIKISVGVAEEVFDLKNSGANFIR